jgi:hypothetical protein
MTMIRTLLAGLTAAAIATPVLADGCLQPAERTAFDLRALQSQLMVAALACGQQDEYNRFVTANQSSLGGAFKQVTTHFRRVHGAQGQKQLDNYITNLANAQSQDGIRQGTQFCRNVAPLFQQALVQRDQEALTALTVQYNLVNPMASPSCPPAPERTIRAATPRRSTPAKPTRTASAH